MNKVRIGKHSVLQNLDSDINNQLLFNGEQVFDNASKGKIDEAYDQKHTHVNMDVLSSLSIDADSSELSVNGTPIVTTEDRLKISESYNNKHEHTNKDVIDSLSINDGRLQVNGTDVFSTSDEQKIHSAFNASHTHDNQSVLDSVTQDVIDNAHTHGNKSVIDSLTSDVVNNSHTHGNSTVLSKFDTDNIGNATFDGEVLAKQSIVDSVSSRISTLHPVDTLNCLTVGTTYPSIVVRQNWYDVPVYVLGSGETVCRLASDDAIGAFATSEIRLMYLTDYITCMPIPALRVTAGGAWYVCYADVFHDALGQTYASGWYDSNSTRMFNAPTLSDMTFDSLIVSNDDPITDLTDLSGEALAALQTLSRMVNVSTDAMGTLGVVENGVQRLTHAPQFGRHYAFTTDRDITLPFPSTRWAADDASFTLDLYCTSSIAMTLPRNCLMDDGKQLDTSAGYHRLTFRYNRNADKISVGEVTQVVPQYWDDIPDQVIPLEDCTWAQIKSIAANGYLNRQGKWCIRRDNQEEVWFEIGDEKTIELLTGETWTLQIWDFKHDDLADGSGKSSITFGMKGLTSDTYKMNTTDTTAGGWEECYFRKQVLLTILNELPQDLWSVIAPVSKVSSAGDATTLVTTTDSLFLPSGTEYGSSQHPHNEGEKYSIFNTNTLAVGDNYWTRTSYSEDYANRWRYITSNGQNSGYQAITPTMVFKVRFAFCI